MADKSKRILEAQQKKAKLEDLVREQTARTFNAIRQTVHLINKVNQIDHFIKNEGILKESTYTSEDVKAKAYELFDDLCTHYRTQLFPEEAKAKKPKKEKS